ncbi:hypothetical protein SORBI_3010G214500 [Sorghum bicolor]|uniref:Uncharacterized protein n=1 Tax=Sorghum bicolor TaxID=4558 RepID=A0A194YLP5_SORBI|nr:hypothetical protein SORBI_3010G214500 [Sorghum bicolor]
MDGHGPAAKQTNGLSLGIVVYHLSAYAVSLWISWFTGCVQVGSNLPPLDPATVRSHVRLRGLCPAKRYYATSSLAISSPFLLCTDFLFPSLVSWIHSTKR